MTPLGTAEAVAARGTLMGNRGCLHDPERRIVRSFRGRRWITCVLAFKGRRRAPLMAPGRYTELFFLDEATALAAGHRPCFECRRADATAFASAWRASRPGDAPGAEALDRRLHAERMSRDRASARCARLPDGVMALFDERPHVVDGGSLRAWSHEGYGDVRRPPRAPVDVLTPPSVVAVLDAGWTPAQGLVSERRRTRAASAPRR